MEENTLSTCWLSRRKWNILEKVATRHGLVDVDITRFGNNIKIVWIAYAHWYRPYHNNYYCQRKSHWKYISFATEIHRQLDGKHFHLAAVSKHNRQSIELQFLNLYLNQSTICTQKSITYCECNWRHTQAQPVIVWSTFWLVKVALFLW